MLRIIVSKERDIIIVLADSYREVKTELMARADLVIVNGLVMKNRYV